MMKLRIRRKKRRPTLMLTSLLDMFTIILIFMIVSFDAEDQDVRLNPDLQLPESSARSVFKPAVNVAVTTGGVLVNDEQVATFVDGKADPGDHAAQQIPSVVDALARVLSVRQPDADDEDGPIMMLQADKELAYETLYLVMRSARIAGFGKFRLIIMKK